MLNFTDEFHFFCYRWVIEKKQAGVFVYGEHAK